MMKAISELQTFNCEAINTNSEFISSRREVLKATCELHCSNCEAVKAIRELNTSNCEVTNQKSEFYTSNCQMIKGIREFSFSISRALFTPTMSLTSQSESIFIQQRFP